MFKFNRFIVIVSLASWIAIMTNAYPVAAKKAATIYREVAPNQKQTILLGLKARNQAQLTKFIYQTVTPGSDNYRKYLTPRQFGQKYGLSDQKVKVISKYFYHHHLKAYTYPGNLVMSVSGKNKDIETVFHLNIKRSINKKHNYQIADGHGQINGPLKGSVTYLDKEYLFYVINNGKVTKPKPKQTHKPGVLKEITEQQAIDGTKDPNIHDRSFKKFLRVYNADGLQQAGHLGQKQTIGILTSSNVNLKDVQSYWKKYGVANQPNRIQKVYVDQFTENDSGDQEEATMDVEQSSSVAPQANVKIYMGDATGDDPSILNYARAISDNKVSVISNSYGTFESDYISHHRRNSQAGFKTLNLLLQQAAAQGITNFNAAGDNGAYAFQAGSKQVSAGVPVDSPYVTAVGGTTLPFQKFPFSLMAEFNAKFKLKVDKTVSIDHEIAWNQNNLLKQLGVKYIRQSQIDYMKFIIAHIKDPKLKKSYQKKLKEQIARYKQKKVSAAYLYTVYSGGGGGISRFFNTPIFQQQIDGIGSYDYGNYINVKNGKANYNPNISTGERNGRYLPDISGNADPYTGYSVFFRGKDDILGGNGTSVITPQMAGMAAVINSSQGARTGFWNPQLYRFAKQSDSPFTLLNSPDNNNNYYVAQPSKIYNPVTGLGTVDFAKLNAKFSNN